MDRVAQPESKESGIQNGSYTPSAILSVKCHISQTRTGSNMKLSYFVADFESKKYGNFQENHKMEDSTQIRCFFKVS